MYMLCKIIFKASLPTLEKVEKIRKSKDLHLKTVLASPKRTLLPSATSVFLPILPS